MCKCSIIKRRDAHASWAARCIHLAHPASSVYYHEMIISASDTSSLRWKATRALLITLLSLSLGFVGITDFFAQAKLGRLVAHLVDESGNTVSGVEVQLQSGETHIQQKTISNDSGEVFFRGLPFGTYSITIADSRFEPVR